MLTSTQTTTTTTTTASATKNQQVKQQSAVKSVSFAPNVEMHEVTHRNEIAKDERDRIWFNRNDFKSIREHVRVTVDLYEESGERIPRDYRYELCMRGLEDRTVQGSELRDRYRYESISAVLDEQERQKYEKTLIPERVAAIYRFRSAASRDAAIQRAAKDAEYVKNPSSTSSTTTGRDRQQQQQLRSHSMPNTMKKKSTLLSKSTSSSSATTSPKVGFRRRFMGFSSSR